MTGPYTVFEGRFGIIKTYPGQRERDFERLLDGLGQEWECVKTSFKTYPRGHLIHQFLDGVLHLRREQNLAAGDVARITCRIADWMISVVCEPVTAKRRSATDYHAKISLQFCVAAAWIFDRLGVEACTEENIADPDILDLADRIDYEIDIEATHRRRFRGCVLVETRDGRQLKHLVEDIWGSAANPMTGQQIRRKFLENATLVLPERQAREIPAMVGELEAISDTHELLRACRPSTVSPAQS
ncbi:hypothetical protein VQ044_21995 [Aurantimonas sp. C2-5-R2]|nr:MULTISPECIES: hypothetical protein [unclassified Aurantimonas]MEC5293281.1 hypothetical protein [Aurantimonas sp. C2-3-R2]MEC5414374.1 hypothetical protein [Aurantimonas sp. C2-4-R8]